MGAGLRRINAPGVTMGRMQRSTACVPSTRPVQESTLPSEDSAMPLLHLRITGTEDDVRLLTDLLNDVDGIERIEEIADLMPHMDDEDSSSAGLTDDRGGDLHALEVEAASPYADTVREMADDIAARYGLVLEFVDEF